MEMFEVRDTEGTVWNGGHGWEIKGSFKQCSWILHVYTSWGLRNASK